MPKSYRIRTEVGQDKYINVQLEQDFEQLEILSLKINESDIYTRVCSDYGVVVGRVLVNGGFGVPNAKVSVFIPLSSEDETNPIISELYPYKSLSDLNEDGYRYNLLPKDPSYSVHAATGTFPTRQEVLLDQSYIEVYDKYYKFSVKTNDSGDFMIFGVPTGNQTIVMDVDLSDIGCFSLAPQDLIDLGIASPSQVNGNTFKASSNLSELPQIKTLNKVVEISPFWGDVDICQFGITRVDFDLTAEANIKIEPKAVFMGSIITNAEDDALKTNCKPKNNTGNLCELITGPGQIFAIRHTIFPDQFNRPQLETYEFDDNGKVIDGDGSFLVNVPMNIDYVITNEFGQQVISTDPKKGIPTKGRYRFKFKWENEQGLQNQYQRANFLVPNIKEHGWTSSGNDPFNPSSTSQVVITLPAGVVTGTTIPVVGTGGYLLEDRINSANLTIIINGQPYFGDPTSIPVTAGDTIQFISNPVDNTQSQTFNITFLPQSYFDVLKSYAFSLDWDDYNDVQGAINCEDTFYEFNFNKVYTTAMFLDRYKNGLGRARHLGIKEIDNRTCKTTVNTFPVNDIIRNFDFLFFVFNLLINILTFPILVLLFIAHLICFLWPILKYALIFLGLWLIYQQVVAAVEFTNSVLELTAVAVPGGPVINTGVILRTIWEGLQILFKLALSILFTIFVVNRLIKIKNFPRIALPMLSYPECNTCECDCKNAEQDDDFDSSTISQQIQNTANSLQSSSGSQPQTATSTSFLAPINLPQTYLVNHPNLEQRPGFDGNDDSGGYFLLCNAVIPPFPPFPIEYRSLVNRIVAQDVGPNVVTQAVLDFKRLFSGYDVLSGNDFRRFKAPQPFLFSVDKIGDNPLIPINYDQRYYAQPRTVPYPQRLNEFNTRDKYFSGVNRIQMKVNNSAPINDQILVMLVNPGTKESLVAGSLFSFQDPKTSNCQINLTGATLNQFDNNAITGTSLTNPISITQTINYATSPTANASVQISIIQSGSSENYLKYPTDIEYYQVITGLTVGSFATLANFTNPNDFPLGYLYHKIRYDIMKPTDCWNPPATPLASPPYVTSPTVAHGKTVNNFTALQQINSYQNYEILFVVRGVDPHTEKQNIKYDLSRIFGKAIGTGPTFEGQYYLNIPIQGYPGGTKPKSHKTTTNTSPNLYFPSYTFTIDPTMYSAFTSTLPYYFISTDDSTVPNNSNYKPTPVHQTTQTIAGTPLTQIGGTSSYKLPKYDTQPLQIGGGTFIAYKSNSYPFNPISTFPGVLYFQSLVYGTPQQQKEAYGWPGPTSIPTNDVYALYSSAYYRFTTLTPVNFNNSVNIVMRSDRLPTSSRTENGFDPRTGYGLHQNNNFKYYTVDAAGDNGTTTSFAPSLPSGESADTDIPPNILSTLDCENIVPLECYQGTGVNLSINPNCAIPPNRVVKGCYCLLNYVENNDPVTSLIFKKLYLIKKQFETDAKLFVEWKTRFTITFAACRGVFAQTFQNNWINGTLYMFTFNKRNRYSLTNPTQPTYDYCEDVILFNDINNGFYYRSSPWNGTNFIGKNSPAPPSGIPPVLINDYPGLGYNGKQIQFPTTIVDLGPREKFISEICTSSNFDGYMIDQVKSTSYQDNSDIIQLGFLSRLTNDRFIQAVIPISNPAGDNTEGKGIIQFFNSNRKADRIDGDFAQMLSINSEWRITPFLAENYSLIPNSIFFDEDTQTGNGYPRPVFGLFFQTPVIDYTYRRNLTPGYETLNYSPLLQNYYGFPKTQDVPFYRWKIESQSNFIFGNENNNWDVTPAPGQPGTGFLTRGYQDLDFTLPNQYYKTPTTELGYLVNFDIAGNPQPSPNFADSYLVGAPYHFYFGLNNGKTAIDKFIKLYISTEG